MANSVAASLLIGGVVFLLVALYAADLGNNVRDCSSCAIANQDLSTTDDKRVLQKAPETAMIHHDDDVARNSNDGKNWSVVRWFDASPSSEQLSELLPDLNDRNITLMYMVNPKTDQWSECLVRWNKGTWQHQATLRLQDHTRRATRATNTKEVGKIVGLKWGFGSGISTLARGIAHGLARDEPVW